MIAPLAYRLALLLAAAISVTVAYTAWRRRPKPGAIPLVVNMAAVTTWLLTTVLSWSTADPAAMQFWRRATYVGIAVTIPSLFVFALEYAGLEEYVTLRLIGALAVPAIGINVLVWTNAWHGLVWDPATTPGTPATFAYGPAFWAVIAYSYLLVVGAVTLLFRSALGAASFYRGQLALITLGTLAPLGGNLVFLLTDIPYDLAPLAFAVTGTAFAFALRRYRLLDLSPVVRERLVGEMDDLVFVLDEGGRIVDGNPAAREQFDEPELVGTRLDALVDANFRASDGPVPIESPGDDGQSFYDVTVSEVGTDQRRPAGELVVFRDVTELTSREEELRLLRQVMSRYIRHNLRNDLNVIMGRADRLAKRGNGEAAAIAERIVQTAESTVESTEKVRLAQRVVETDADRTRFDLVEEVEDALAELGRAYPAVTVERSLPNSAGIRASGFIPVAIRNVLENACEHTAGDEPRVSVRIERDGDSTALHVEDNGPGIPAGELAALDVGEERPLAHGSGIGLYLVDWIVDRSGGDLAFDSDPTRVTLRLPSAPAGESQGA